MRLLAIIPQAELEALISELLPVTILLGHEADDRVITLRDPSHVRFAPGRGVQMGCKADIRWSVLGIKVPIRLHALDVLLTPRVTEREEGRALVFHVAIERADLAGIPAFVDEHLVDRVNQALSERQVELAWGFEKNLTHSFTLPPILSNLRSFNLGVAEGVVDVTADALRLALELQAGITRR